MNLRQYQTIKYSLVEILRSLPWRSETALRNRTLFECLAMDRFNVAVVGRYSRGKSTLLNALTGLDRLPMGTEPLTSVITSLRYGTDEKAIVHFEDTSLTEDVPISDIEGYVTERGNHANRRRIREVEIILPAAILRSGFRFVDTPGLGSIVRANTETTLAFLSEIDVFLFVTACDGILEPDELSLLTEIASTRKPVFPVLNKVDLVPVSDILRMSEALQVALQESGVIGALPVFCISAVQALVGRLSHDNDLLQRSGLPFLEKTLTAFLLTERRKTFLVDMCNRLTEAVQQDSPEETDDLLLEIDCVRRKVESSREDLSVAEESVQAVFRGTIPPCPVCQHIEKNVFNHLTFLQGALRKNLQIKEAFLQDGGFCPAHTNLFRHHAAPREIATAYAPLLMQEAAYLRECVAGNVQSRLLLRCSACEVVMRTTCEQTDELVRIIEGSPSAFKRAIGLCRVHFERIFDRISDVEQKEVLLRQQAAILERVADDMNGFALKQDASRRDAMVQTERSAPHSGLDLWIGLANAEITQSVFSAVMAVKDRQKNRETHDVDGAKTRGVSR